MRCYCTRNGRGEGAHHRPPHHVSHQFPQRRMKEGDISKTNIFVSTLIATVGSSGTYIPSRFSGTTLKAPINSSSMETEHGLIPHRGREDDGAEIQHVLDIALKGDEEPTQDEGKDVSERLLPQLAAVPSHQLLNIRCKKA